MYIGIDIGGTNCRVAFSPSLDLTKSFEKEEFKLSHDFKKDFSSLIEIVSRQGKIDGIGIGIVGTLNKEKTQAIFIVNLPEWTNEPIVQILSERFACSTVIENDIAATALGEYYFGNGKNENFYYIGWGTGLGGAKVIGGTHPNSEKLHWKEYFGQWEKDCGGSEIQEKYGKKAEHLSEGEWRKVMEQFKNYLAEFIEKTHAEEIIFAGGISWKQKVRLEKIFPFFSISLKISSLGEDAGLFGAFALIKNNL